MKGVNLTMANAQTVVLTTKHAQDTKVSEIDTSKLLTFVLFLLLWLKICPACANDLEVKELGVGNYSSSRKITKFGGRIL